MPVSDESVKLAMTAADAADDIKADELTILEVGDLLGIVDIFVLASTGSDRQLKAVVRRIEERLHLEHDRKVIRREGVPESGWMLLDYGDIVCHVFTREQRGIYALERLWADCPRRDPKTGEQLLPTATVALEEDSYDEDSVGEGSVGEGSVDAAVADEERSA